MRLTNHALKRVQQRGLSQAIIDLILEYGEPSIKPGGVVEYKINPKIRQQRQSQLKKEWAFFEKAAHKAVLIDPEDGTIITAYHLNN